MAQHIRSIHPVASLAMRRMAPKQEQIIALLPLATNPHTKTPCWALINYYTYALHARKVGRTERDGEVQKISWIIDPLARNFDLPNFTFKYHPHHSGHTTIRAAQSEQNSHLVLHHLRKSILRWDPLYASCAFLRA
jgi:hypothetical protein